MAGLEVFGYFEPLGLYFRAYKLWQSFQPDLVPACSYPQDHYHPSAHTGHYSLNGFAMDRCTVEFKLKSLKLCALRVSQALKIVQGDWLCPKTHVIWIQIFIWKYNKNRKFRSNLDGNLENCYLLSWQLMHVLPGIEVLHVCNCCVHRWAGSHCVF